MTDVFPTEGIELTHILVASDLRPSVAYYRDPDGHPLRD
jgi:hypothetical protein